MTGVSGSSAVRMSVTASSSSYSTLTISAASSATARLVATTAATASPCQQTRSLPLASQAPAGGGLDRIDDGLVAGTAAVIAGKMPAYPLPVRLGILSQ